MRLFLLTAWLWAALGGVAAADPVTATIVGTFFAAGTTAAAIATFVINTAITLGLGALTSKLLAPKARAGAAQERQASVVTMSLGEVPREMIVGFAGTGGSLADVVNFGGEYGTDREALVIVVADHECEQLVSFWIGDQQVSYSADGAVTGYNGQLEVYWRPGAIDDAAFPEGYQSLSPALGPDALKGQAKILVIYSLDRPEATAPVFPAGRPSFLWEIKGAKVYDPRLDATVDGGEGAQRRDDPSTWTWSANAELCRYAYSTGVYYPGHFGEAGYLLIGRGLTAYEAAPASIVAAANICDELVEEGEAEVARYRVGGVLRSDQSFIEVEEMFAAAMAGRIIQPAGGVAVEPGQGKTPIEITDADLLVGREATFNEHKSDSDRINTVVVRYVEPAQKWQDHAAGVQRLEAVDLIADGGPRSENLSLSLVTHRGQAERIGAIRLAEARLERSAAIVLGQRFWFLEEGDWLRWTSARHTKGSPVDFRVAAFDLGGDWTNALALEEVSADSYDGVAGVTTTLPSSQVPVPDALVLTGVTATALQLEGDGGALLPAIRFTWDTPVDAAILRIRAEVRKLTDPVSAPTVLEDVNAGDAVVTNGVAWSTFVQARLVPLGGVGRPIVPSGWITVATDGAVATSVTHLFDRTVAEAVAQIDAANAEGVRIRDEVRALAQGVLEGLDVFHNHGKTVELLHYEGDSNDPIKWVFRQDLNVLDEADTRTVSWFSLLGAANGVGDAWDLNLSTVKVGPGETMATRLSGIASSLGANSAAISSEITARTNAVSAVASSVTSLTTTVGGHTSAITSFASSIDGLSARWGVSVDVDGHVGGIVLNNSGTTVDFTIRADKFAITGDGVTADFGVEGGVVYANNLRVGLLFADTVTTNNLVGGAVTTSVAGENTPGVSLSVGVQIEVMSESFDSTGGKHIIQLTATNATSTSTAAGAVIRVKINGTEVGHFNIYVPGSWGGLTYGTTVMAQPGAGTHTLSMTAEATNLSGPSTNERNTWVNTELKKSG